MSISRSGTKHWGYGKSPSADTRKKISASNKGFVPSEEARRKISAANSGRVLSDDHKNKIRLSKLGKKRKPFSRKPASEETKAKISLALILRNQKT